MFLTDWWSTGSPTRRAQEAGLLTRPESEGQSDRPLHVLREREVDRVGDQEGTIGLNPRRVVQEVVDPNILPCRGVRDEPGDRVGNIQPPLLLQFHDGSGGQLLGVRADGKDGLRRVEDRELVVRRAVPFEMRTVSPWATCTVPLNRPVSAGVVMYSSRFRDTAALCPARGAGVPAEVFSLPLSGVICEIAPGGTENEHEPCARSFLLPVPSQPSLTIPYTRENGPNSSDVNLAAPKCPDTNVR